MNGSRFLNLIAYESDQPSKIPVAIWRHHEMAQGRGKRGMPYTRGQATSFGFKRPVSSIPVANNNQIASSPEELEDSLDLLVISQSTARCGTPRLARPKKDANGNSNTRTNRFGFRGGTPLSNKVADSQANNDAAHYMYTPDACRVNSSKTTLKFSGNRSIASESGQSSGSDNNDSNHQSETTDQQTPAPTRFTLHTSHLPRPQFPVRLATPANYRKPADKNAKTAANNHTARKARSEHGSSSASSVTDIDSGMGSQKSNGEMETQTIEQLDSSPSIKNRLRNTNFQKSRPMEMVLSGTRKKTFELRDLEDSIEVTEILPLPPLRSTRLPTDTGIVRERSAAYSRALARDSGVVRSIGTFSSDDEGDEGYEDETGEEKLHRDRLLSEKDEKGILGAGECEADGVGAGEELWGHGEAMAGDDDLSATQSQPDSDQGCVDTMIPPLRSVLLTIEDPTFATLAAMSTSSMLEDEQSPETPDFGSSPSSTSVDPPALPPPPEMMSPCEKKNLSGSPDSPGTPTHASNSLSLSSDARDFLIDDEIADQPGLMFDETVTGNSSGNTLVPPSPGDETNAAPDVPIGNKPMGRAGRLSVECSPAHARRGSVGTLSPCESIASDDLMMDYDPSETSSTFDDSHIDPRSFYRLEGTGLNDLDETALMSELETQSDQVLKEWSSLLSTHTGLSNGVRATRLLRTRVGSSGSGGDSPRSLDTPRMRSGLSSPLRPSRQATSSPGDDLSDDSGIRLDKGLYQNMFQDVINIKTLLLRLKRVLQDGDVSNPFDNSLKNGLCYSVASNDTSSAEDTPTKTKDGEQISDLKRQVVFQQHQIEEKERLIQALQAQVAKYEQTETSVPTSVETCNAATQTERIRPLSTGPSLLSGIPSDNPGGSLVSSTSESWSRSLPRQNDNKTNTLSSRVPVGPWRRTANANTEQTTTRKFLNTPIPQRRSSHPKTS